MANGHITIHKQSLYILCGEEKKTSRLLIDHSDIDWLVSGLYVTLHLLILACCADKIDSMDELENDSMDIEDSYIVIKNYTKSSADELDLAVGQLACVIDDSDPGKEGFFCFCFVFHLYKTCLRINKGLESSHC